MDQSLLSTRDIVGIYFDALETNTGAPWVDAVSNMFNSDQESETYNFLRHVPAFREWSAGRQAKGLLGDGFTIKNVHYEATLEFTLRDMRRDKTSQIEARIMDLVDRQQTHWASLLTTLIEAGTSTACYDGQFFFDTDHSEGDSGSQSNDITVDISTLPVTTAGTVTNPHVEEMQQSIYKGIAQILSIVDNQGEPMNENARSFGVMVPFSLYDKALAATQEISTRALPQNLNPNLLANFSIDVWHNARSSWTDSFAVFRTDSPIKGLIRQEETAPDLKAKDENSEFAFDNDAVQIGVDSWRSTGYGLWQRACYVTMI